VRKCLACTVLAVALPLVLALTAIAWVCLLPALLGELAQSAADWTVDLASRIAERIDP